jgi:hypothetical protein
VFRRWRRAPHRDVDQPTFEVLPLGSARRFDLEIRDAKLRELDEAMLERGVSEGDYQLDHVAHGESDTEPSRKFRRVTA